MIRKTLILLTLISFGNVYSQDIKDSQKLWGIKFEGFLKTDFWYDSRDIAGAREDLFLLYPLKPVINESGIDINDRPSFNFSAITSRLTGKISGPDAFGAKASGVLEADFSGISNSDVDGFRLRHAYIKLSWKHSNLILGQYWHPMFVVDVFPTVLALNTGAPFQPFIRSPQVRYTYQLGNFKFLGAALSQLDYVNEGPEGRSSEYLRNAALPNLHVQGQFSMNKVLVGAALDYKTIQPQLNTVDPANSATLASTSYMIFSKFTTESLTIKAKFIQGENMTEHLMLGGYYAVLDTSNGFLSNYRSTRHSSMWINLIYAKKSMQYSIFAGYSKLNTSMNGDENVGFGRGLNIDNCYRIAPMVTRRSGNVQICAEVEYTVAGYAKSPYIKEVNETGIVRTQVTAFYFF